MSEEKKREIFPEMNSKGSIIGTVPREVAHGDKERVHAGVRILMLDPNTGRVLLQFRREKDLDPFCWDYSGGGHPEVIDRKTGEIETYRQTAKRELLGEIRAKPGTYKLRRVPGHKLDTEEQSQVEWATWFIAEIPESKMPPSETKTNEVEKVKLVNLKDLLEVADGNPALDNSLKSEKFRPMLLRDLRRPRLRKVLEEYVK